MRWRKLSAEDAENTDNMAARRTRVSKSMKRK
jgi:hypothetical protein